jgi:hypothetical protein
MVMVFSFGKLSLPCSRFSFQEYHGEWPGSKPIGAASITPIPSEAAAQPNARAATTGTTQSVVDSAIGEVEKCHDGVFQQARSGWPKIVADFNSPIC